MINGLIRLQPRGERAYDVRWLDQNDGILQLRNPVDLLQHLEWLLSNPDAKLYDAPALRPTTPKAAMQRN